MKGSNSVNNTLSLIEIGIDLLGKQGYNGTGVKELVDKAGVPKGSFYNYFNSKEDFAVKALERYAKHELIFIGGIMSDKSLTPLHRIEKLFIERINKIENSNYTKFCLITSLADEMSVMSPSIARSVNIISEKINTLLTDCLTEAQQLGEIKLNLNVKQLAEFIENSWRGTLILVKAEKSLNRLHDFLNFLLNNLLN